MTDNEIIKAEDVLKKLEEAYNAYYDTSKGMPYDIDETIRKSAICIDDAIKEINRLKAENERLQKDNEYILMQHKFQRRPSGDCWNDVIEKAKAEAIKEVVGRLQKSIISQLGISTLEKKEAFCFCLDEIDEIEEEMVGETE